MLRCRRETERDSRELEETLLLVESQVLAARSEVEQQQMVTRDHHQQERDKIHAQLQEEAHRRQVQLNPAFFC